MSQDQSQPSRATELSAESGEESLIQARREKAMRVRERGENPFANDVAEKTRTFVGDLRAIFASALRADETYDGAAVAALAAQGTFTVFGRLLARRGFGKASFLRLRDDSGEIQLFAKADVLGACFAVLKDLDVGDHIEAHGTAIVTKTGERIIADLRKGLFERVLTPQFFASAST